MERRRSPRTAARLDVLISSGAEEGAGELVELSHTGALVEEAALQPAVGARVRLYVYRTGNAPLPLEGRVVRHVERGFALSCELHDAAQRGHVDAIVAQLGSPQRAARA